MEKSKGYSIASLTLTILGLILLFMPYLAIFLSILGLVFSTKNNDGMSIAGKVMGIIGIVLNTLLLFILLVGFLLWGW